MRLQELNRTAIYPNPDQPRKNFDEDALDELAGSLRQHGLLQALVVRPNGKGFQIIAGERRWRAAERAGLSVLPCNVLEGLGDEEAMVLSITENVARQDMDELEEANAYDSLRRMGRTIPEIAKLFGKTQRCIETSLDLLNLNEPVQWLVARGHLSKNAGVYMSRLSPTGQSEVIQRMNAGEFPDGDAMLRHCTVVQKQEAQPGMFEAIEDELTRARRRATKATLEVAWNKAIQMSAALAAIYERDPKDVAFALDVDVTTWAAQADALLSCVTKVRNTLRDAAAIKSVVA